MGGTFQYNECFMCSRNDNKTSVAGERDRGRKGCWRGGKGSDQVVMGKITALFLKVTGIQWKIESREVKG